jgi:hypothetical protein
MTDAHEIASLRDALDEQTGRAEWNYELVTRCEERVIQRDAEIARLRITPEERAAIEGLMMGGCEPPEEVLRAWIDAVRGLLARHA